MLNRQYRMHPSISRFPSKEFYGTRLLDGTVDKDGRVPVALLPPKSSHLLLDSSSGDFPSAIFLDHAGRESRRDRSLLNNNEAAIVCSVIEDLLLHNPVSGTSLRRTSALVSHRLLGRSRLLGPILGSLLRMQLRSSSLIIF
jgi:AAA domain